MCWNILKHFFHQNWSRRKCCSKYVYKILHTFQMFLRKKNYQKILLRKYFNFFSVGRGLLPPKSSVYSSGAWLPATQAGGQSMCFLIKFVLFVYSPLFFLIIFFSFCSSGQFPLPAVPAPPETLLPPHLPPRPAGRPGWRHCAIRGARGKGGAAANQGTIDKPWPHFTVYN